MVKRCVALCLMLICLGLGSGCDSRPGPPMQSEGSLTANIELKGERYTAQIEQGGEFFEIKYQTPEELSGLKLVCDRGAWKISYQGLEMPCEESSLTNAVVQNIYQAFRDAQTQVSFSGVIQGQIDSGEYTLKITESGEPESLQIPSIQLNLQFEKTTQK